MMSCKASSVEESGTSTRRQSRGSISRNSILSRATGSVIAIYHAAKQLSDAVKLRRWSATQRTRWLNRTRGCCSSEHGWTR